MNKRITGLFLTLLIVFLLGGCGKGGDGDSSVVLLVSEDDMIEERIEQVVTAISNEDKNSLKELFSKDALGETIDFDGAVDSFFSFIKGEIVSWDRESWSSSESIRNGKKTLMIRASYQVITTEETYSFFMIDYHIDTINPSNEGIYMVEVYTADYNGEWLSWQERMQAGIVVIK